MSERGFKRSQNGTRVKTEVLGKYASLWYAG